MNTQTITVIGGNLWAIAAQYMGDAQQASRLAVINGLTDSFPADPFINGQVTLTIPAPDSTQSGGLIPA